MPPCCCRHLHGHTLSKLEICTPGTSKHPSPAHLLTCRCLPARPQAKGLADFLLAMLEPSPDKRASAQRMLEHPWLRGELSEGSGGDDGRRGSRSRGRSRSRSREAGQKKSRY